MHLTHFSRRLYGSLKRRDDTESVIFVGPGTIDPWSCGRLREAAESIATTLCERHEAAENDVRIIPMTMAREVSIDVLGSMLAGVVPLVLDRTTANPKSAAFADIRDRIRSAGYGLIAPGAEGDERLERATPSSSIPASPLRVLQSTSGTTGSPNLCMWGETQILASVESMAQAMALRPNDLSFCWTPLNHTVGLLNNLILCLLTGTGLALMDTDVVIRKPVRWLEGLSEVGATLTWTPNFAIALVAHMVDDDDLVRIDLSRLRAIWNAGERVDVDQYRRFGARLARAGLRPDALKTNYGCAEHIGGATFLTEGGIQQGYETVVSDQLSIPDHCKSFEPARGHCQSMVVASVGAPAPGVTLRIVDESGLAQPDGVVGQITLQADSTFLGYLGDAAATARALQNGALRTGDLGYIRDGSLFWIGRSNELINVRGRKYDANQFQQAFSGIALAHADAFVAFGVDDAESGTEGAVLVVESSLGNAPKDLIRSCRRAALERMGLNLKDVVVVAPGTLSTTASGKKRHNHYRLEYLSGALESQRMT